MNEDEWAALEDRVRGLARSEAPAVAAMLVRKLAELDRGTYLMLESANARLVALGEKVDAAVKGLAAEAEREDFNKRLEALKAAREHVAGLPSEQPNAKGYRDQALKPEERTAQELRVARYLLGES